MSVWGNILDIIANVLLALCATMSAALFFRIMRPGVSRAVANATLLVLLLAAAAGMLSFAIRMLT
jgi:hypothetical protein